MAWGDLHFTTIMVIVIVLSVGGLGLDVVHIFVKRIKDIKGEIDRKD